MKKLLYLLSVPVVVVSFYIHSLYASNVEIIKRPEINTGAVYDVIINGVPFTAEDLEVTIPGTTYEWTPQLAEEHTRPPNVGPGLEGK